MQKQVFKKMMEIKETQILASTDIPKFNNCVCVVKLWNRFNVT